MPYHRFQMLYNNDNYYRWSSDADQVAPATGSGNTILNRTEGSEVLYFINYMAEKYLTGPVAIGTYQKMERMIKFAVNSYTRSHHQVERWILANWSKFSSPARERLL